MTVWSTAGGSVAVETPFLFLRKFLREGRRVARFTPSSRALARAATRLVDASLPQVIVELGAGTGAVTEQALARCHPESRLVAIELDDDFTRILRRRCPRATVIQGDAVELHAHLRGAGIARVDLVISGLALPSLDVAGRSAVVRAFREFAAPGASFSQITVMPLIYFRLYRRLFREVRFEWALWNVPPAGVYHCRDWSGQIRGK